MTIIDREELLRLIAQDPELALLEALPERYFVDGHLPGAQLFPHTEVAQRAAAQLPDKQQTIVVYCASETCRNSHTAAALLSNLGYQRVSVYGGGKADWVAAGLPLERQAA